MNLTMLVGQELRFGWALVVKSENYSFDVSLDCEAACAVIVIGGIIPLQVNACKFVSFPIF